MPSSKFWLKDDDQLDRHRSCIHDVDQFDQHLLIRANSSRLGYFIVISPLYYIVELQHANDVHV